MGSTEGTPEAAEEHRPSRATRRALVAGAGAAVAGAGIAALTISDGAGAAGAVQYNVTDPYGATGDGSTDDTKAIRKAIDAANAAGGGTVFFPPGTYITGPLTIYSNIVLLGSGIRASTLKFNGDAKGHMVMSDGEINSWLVQRIALDGNSAATDGLHVQGFGFQIQNCVIFGCNGYGIWSSLDGDSNSIDFDAMEALVSGVKVHHCIAGGIYWDGPHDSLFDDLIVYLNGPEGDSIATGIEVTPSGLAVAATNCHVWGLTHKYAWKLGGNAYLTNCQGEGASGAQVLVLANGCQIFSGAYFSGRDNGQAAGVEIGDGDLAPTGTQVQSYILNCELGAVKFTSDGGLGLIAPLVYQMRGAAITGEPNTTHPNSFDVTVTGGAESGLAGLAPDVPKGAVRVTGGVGFYDAVDASGSPGKLVRKIPAYDANGNLMGYVPVYG